MAKNDCSAPARRIMFGSAPFILFLKRHSDKRSLFVVFLLHVGSDLRILIDRLEVSIDLLVGLDDCLRNTIQHSSIEPAHQSPHGQVSNGHLVANIKS